MTQTQWVLDEKASGFGHRPIVTMVQKDKDKITARVSFCGSCYRQARTPADMREVNACGSSNEGGDSLERRRLGLIQLFGELPELQRREKIGSAAARSAGW